MTISTAVEPVRPSDEAAAKRGERRALGVACGAHMLHDGYTDLVWVALPIWQAEFGLNYAMVGLLRTIYSGTLASLQIPAAAIAARIGAGTVLSVGTALAGLCYCLAGLTSGFALLGFVDKRYPEFCGRYHDEGEERTRSLVVSGSDAAPVF